MPSGRGCSGVQGESGSVPEHLNTRTPERLTSFPAIRLFVQRARAAETSFEMTGHNAPSVVEICRRLEGIPLAIELAAARVRAMSVEQVAARLRRGFGLLREGSRALIW